MLVYFLPVFFNIVLNEILSDVLSFPINCVAWKAQSMGLMEWGSDGGEG